MSSRTKIFNAAAILYAVCGEWAGLMSGGLSVLFTLGAFFYEHERRMFVFLAFAALWLCVVRLAYQNYPKFKLECSKDIDLCATPKDANKARYFRMRVLTNCVNGIEKCSGNLEKIEKDGIVVFQGDATELPFAKPENRSELSILMKPEIYHWLDILVVIIHHYTKEELGILFDYTKTPLPADRDIVLISTKQPYTPPNDINGQYAFNQIGEYILYVSVSGKGVPTAKAQLKFNWTGKANTSTIERIK
ncbi:MAG: hypothetical protein ABSF51_10335 [Verrucomicrobiota bacterium]|jgi:hypothetical protein